MKVADKVAREWRVLSEDDDLTFGNEIVIRNNTQNIYVTMSADGELAAFFIPRLRTRVSTSADRPVRKMNAGVLEMMGYFVIDNEADFNVLKHMTGQERKALGDAWLSDLKPDKSAIEEFERNVKICLSTAVDPLEQRIDELMAKRRDDWRIKARDILHAIQSEAGLEPDHREHLYRELIFAILEPTDSEMGNRAREL